MACIKTYWIDYDRYDYEFALKPIHALVIIVLQ